MEEEGYPTPEAAAIEDIPERYVKVLAASIAPDKAHAVFLLATNEEPWVDLYLQPCYLEHGRWHPGPEDWGAGPGGGGGSGRATLTFGSPPATALIVDGPAPRDATAAVVEFEGVEHRVSASDGRYLFVGWNPQDAGSSVLVKGFTPGGATER
jgi:hypothetical protein